MAVVLRMGDDWRSNLSLATGALENLFVGFRKALRGSVKSLNLSTGNSVVGLAPRRAQINPLSSIKPVTSLTKSIGSLFGRIRKSRFLYECADRIKTVKTATSSFLETHLDPTLRPHRMVPVIPTGRNSLPRKCLDRSLRYGGNRSCRRKPVEVYVNFMLQNRPMVYHDPSRRSDTQSFLDDDNDGSVGEDLILSVNDFTDLLRTACENERQHRL